MKKGLEEQIENLQILLAALVVELKKTSPENAGAAHRAISKLKRGSKLGLSSVLRNLGER